MSTTPDNTPEPRRVEVLRIMDTIRLGPFGVVKSETPSAAPRSSPTEAFAWVQDWKKIVGESEQADGGVREIDGIEHAVMIQAFALTAVYAIANNDSGFFREIATILDWAKKRGWKITTPASPQPDANDVERAVFEEVMHAIATAAPKSEIGRCGIQARFKASEIAAALDKRLACPPDVTTVRDILDRLGLNRDRKRGRPKRGG